MTHTANNGRIRDNINANLAEYFEHMCRWVDNAHVDVNRDYMLLRLHSKIAFYNMFIPKTQKALGNEVLADIEATFNSDGVPYVVGIEEEHMPGAATFLAKLGYQPLPPQPNMYLEGFPADTETNEDVYIERVGTVASISAFWTCVSKTFEFPMDEVRRIYPVAHLRDDSIRHYVAYLEDRPVGAGTAFCAEGMAGIWNLCTVDNFRKRGVATTLLRHALEDAHGSGYETSFFHAMPMSYGLARKLGYRQYSHMQWHLPPGA